MAHGDADVAAGDPDEDALDAGKDDDAARGPQGAMRQSLGEDSGVHKQFAHAEMLLPQQEGSALLLPLLGLEDSASDASRTSDCSVERLLRLSSRCRRAALLLHLLWLLLHLLRLLPETLGGRRGCCCCSCCCWCQS